jgi:hypothetical protein
MSTDGGSTRGAASVLAARLRGFWVSARSRQAGRPADQPGDDAASGQEYDPRQDAGRTAGIRRTGRTDGAREPDSPVPSLLRNAAAWS